MATIKLFLSDVDGTLTDGGMYYTASGDAVKKFNARDGMGLQLLQKTGVKVGIITSEDTPIVRARVEKLGLDFLVQDRRNGGKLAAAMEICQSLGVTLSETAYIDSEQSYGNQDCQSRPSYHNGRCGGLSCVIHPE